MKFNPSSLDHGEVQYQASQTMGQNDKLHDGIINGNIPSIPLYIPDKNNTGFNNQNNQNNPQTTDQQKKRHAELHRGQSKAGSTSDNYYGISQKWRNEERFQKSAKSATTTAAAAAATLPAAAATLPSASKLGKSGERNRETETETEQIKDNRASPPLVDHTEYSYKHNFCYFEFSKKGSCRKGESCGHSHDISDQIRQDKGMKKRIKEERSELWRRNAVLKKVFPAAQGGETVHQNNHTKTPCAKSFIKQGSCKDSKCPDNHQLDFVKIRNGVCFDDLKSKGSCIRGAKCKFTHETPSVLRTDSQFCQTVNRRKDEIEMKKQQSGKEKVNDTNVNINNESCENVFSPGSLNELTKLVSNQMVARK